MFNPFRLQDGIRQRILLYRQRSAAAEKNTGWDFSTVPKPDQS
jgi:hypothetical protein